MIANLLSLLLCGSITAIVCYTPVVTFQWLPQLLWQSLAEPHMWFFLVTFALGYVFVVVNAIYLLHTYFLAFFSRVNVVRKYRCQWALVTGGSSGLGRALAFKLASQGANVVIAALQDRFLEDTLRDLKAKYPNLEFRGVPVDLTDDRHSYYDAIAEATKDIPVNICYLNAGYLKLGPFGKTDLTVWTRNLECNVMSGVRLAHLFVSRMIERKQKGLICFTSSAAAMFPAPSQATYSAGKAFLQNFAQSIAVETHHYGIDTMVVLPGPMLTQFYTANVSGKVDQLDAFKFFLAIAATPDSVADQVTRCAGNGSVIETGAFTVLTRIFVRFADWNSMLAVMKRGVALSGDFDKMIHGTDNKPKAN
jgi:short-subunit dehydrogenase